MSKEVEYEVYVCKKGEIIIYVGEGRFGRHKHCNSGTSHVYGLNKLHFEGEEIEVEVVKVFKTKKEAESYEQTLIDEHLPIYNVKGTLSFKRRHFEVMNTVHTKETYLKWMRLHMKRSVLHKDVEPFISELFNFHGNKNVITGNFKLYTKDKYSSIGLKNLSEFSNKFRYIINNHTTLWVKFTYKYFKEVLNLDLLDLFSREVPETARNYWQTLDLSNL